MLTVGGLFSGIGGWELGLERAGMRVLWHCESDPYARAVLERHWPGVPCYPDVRELRGADVESVDVLCGGFPCQDLSYAGAGAGIDGARSGLWSEYARLVGELRPRYVLVENVSALLARGLGRVLGDLAALGYDAEWDCLPASAFGAPHQRDRVWLVGYPAGCGLVDPESHDGEHAASRRRVSPIAAGSTGEAGSGRAVLADADCTTGAPQESAGQALLESGEVERLGRCGCGEGSAWAVEPDVGRVAHGVAARMDRLRCLGNALVPQIAEWIGRRIVTYEEDQNVTVGDILDQNWASG